MACSVCNLKLFLIHFLIGKWYQLTHMSNLSSNRAVIVRFLLHSANKYVKNMYDAPKIIPLDMKKLILF